LQDTFSDCQHNFTPAANMTSIRRSSTTKHDDEHLAKEAALSQNGVGDFTEIDDRRLKFKIDCWLMPML